MSNQGCRVNDMFIIVTFICWEGHELIQFCASWWLVMGFGDKVTQRNVLPLELEYFCRILREKSSNFRDIGNRMPVVLGDTKMSFSVYRHMVL